MRQVNQAKKKIIPIPTTQTAKLESTVSSSGAKPREGERQTLSATLRHALETEIFQPKMSSLIEMFQVMAELEALCARLAERRMNKEQCEAMNLEHEEMIRIIDGDPSEFHEANKRFHEVIYVGSQNAFLIDQMRALRTRVAPYRRYITFQPGRMQTTIGEHAAVAKAIVDMDPEEAQARMQEHVNLLGDDLNDFIASLPSHLLSAG